MKKNKGILKTYHVLVAVVILALVVGFSSVKAQSLTDETSVLDRVIEILRITNQPEVSLSQGDMDMGLSFQNGDYVVTKKIAYNDIVTTGIDATNPVNGGFVVENVIIEMGALTIASGTQIQVLTSGDTYGTSTKLFATDVAAFPKATTMDLNTAIGSVVGGYSGYASSTQKVFLEDGSKLIIKCTTADCKRTTDGSETGTGYLRVTTILKKADQYSTAFE